MEEWDSASHEQNGLTRPRIPLIAIWILLILSGDDVEGIKV